VDVRGADDDSRCLPSCHKAARETARQERWL